MSTGNTQTTFVINLLASVEFDPNSLSKRYHLSSNVESHSNKSKSI